MTTNTMLLLTMAGHKWTPEELADWEKNGPDEWKNIPRITHDHRDYEALIMQQQEESGMYD